MTSEFGLDTAHGGYDIFMRTTEPFHYEGVSELWRASQSKNAEGNDAIYKGHYEGWFCAPVLSTKPKTSIRNRRTKVTADVSHSRDAAGSRLGRELLLSASDYDEALLSC
jgi:methionyl-tRNA synthetase